MITRAIYRVDTRAIYRVDTRAIYQTNEIDIEYRRGVYRVNERCDSCKVDKIIHRVNNYGVATMSRLFTIKVSFAKEPCERDDILHKRPAF